jgi:hypothetical protein
METADVLYGVSMQAAGVSKLVSQRLDQALRYTSDGGGGASMGSSGAASGSDSGDGDGYGYVFDGASAGGYATSDADIPADSEQEI